MSRFENAPHELMVKLAEAVDAADKWYGTASPEVISAIESIRKACPELRTEAEVAAEALAILRACKDYDELTKGEWATLRALGKEKNRG